MVFQTIWQRSVAWEPMCGIGLMTDHRLYLELTYLLVLVVQDGEIKILETNTACLLLLLYL